MQETHEDKLIQGANNVLFGRVKYEQSIWTNRLFDAVSTREDTSAADDDYVKGRAGCVMLTNGLPRL
jgi:hypothetical protein